ncbi:MAG: recombinase family protein [Candidatus Omnitrophota bacterium]|nr:recombinase family protein [Candidatus Omnitrophota bacterium]
MEKYFEEAMKVAIYIRVSTEDQAKEGTSLEVQREFLINYAKKEGWEIYHPDEKDVYEDDESGYSRERTELKRLLTDAKRGRFNMVLVYKIDRFSRKLKDLLNLVDELEEMNIGLKSATEYYDTTNSAGKMMFQQLGSFAEFERNRIKERVFPGMIKGVQRGNWQGARYSPYGYSYNKLDPEKKLRVVEEEEKIVKLIYTMYLANQSTARIAGYLYKKEYKTRSGGSFHTKLIGDILKNQVYLGKIIWNRHHYDKRNKTRKGYRYIKNEDSKVIIADGRHEAIITQEDFDLVQKKLKANRKGVMHRNGVKEYPLSGILFCGKCNHKYLGSVNISQHRLGIKKRWYRCNARQVHFIKCLNAAVRAEVLEPEIFAILEQIIEHPELKAKRFDNIVQSRVQLADEQLKEQKDKLREELRKNLDKQSRLNEVYLDNLVAIEVFKDKSILLREEEKQLKNEIARVEMRLVEKERSEQYQLLLGRVIDNYEETKKNVDIVAKKEMLRLIFRRIMVDDGKIAGIEFFEPFKRFYEETKCSVTPIKTAGREESYILSPSAVK